MTTEDYIRSEVERQNSTKFEEFSNALEFSRVGPAFELAEMLGTSPVESFKDFVMTIAEMVEPELNEQTMEAALQKEGNLRTSHVGFMNGGTAAPAAEVSYRFHRWAEIWTEIILDPETKPTEPEVDSCIKTLLEIHPWKDGNGRTASILRNWMLGTLDNPTELPYFFGYS